jgi:chemotaxis protein methyltransferase CheR
MNDAECVAFLQWALPRMRLEWRGFRNVRRTVCGRVVRRIRALGLGDVAAYRAYLEASPPEWDELRALCSIPISRFYRDREVFESLQRAALPALADGAIQRRASTLECWSAGCASGEEPYTLSILWQLKLAPRYSPQLQLRVLATDIDPVLLDRAVAACYRSSALKELPLSWRAQAFEQRAGEWCLREQFRAGVRIARQDICATLPDQRFDLILCRNVVFTYFAPELQHQLAQQLLHRLYPGGALVLGLHESFPMDLAGIAPWPGARAIIRRVPAPLSPANERAVDS